MYYLLPLSGVFYILDASIYKYMQVNHIIYNGKYRKEMLTQAWIC